jgi:hypothetical protein
MSSESPERLAVRKILNLLKPNLAAYVEVETGMSTRGQEATAAMQAIIANWETHFGKKLQRVVRTYIFELKDARNRWAHEEEFSVADVRRISETAALVAEAVGVPAPLVDAIRDVAGTQTATTRQVASPSVKAPSQRDIMRALYARYAGDHDRLVREYAEAERSGEVRRKSNKSGHDPEGYARALLADGLKKGWL